MKCTAPRSLHATPLVPRSARPALLCLAAAASLLALPGLAAQASEPLTASFEQRRDQPVGPFVGKQRSTVETLVRAWKEGDLVVRGNKGGPLHLDALPQGVVMRLMDGLRQFARAITPVQRRPSRTVIQDLVAVPQVREQYDFDFDAQSGEIVLRLKEELWRAEIEFNAYQLGAAIQFSGKYLLARASTLEP